jgi:hypothetical protein
MQVQSPHLNHISKTITSELYKDNEIFTSRAGNML